MQTASAQTDDIEAKGSSRQFAALCTATAEAWEKLALILDQNKP